MKKIVMLVLAMSYALLAFSAEIAIGGRGCFNWNVGTTLARDSDVLLRAVKQNGTSLTGVVNFGGGGAVYGDIQLFNNDIVKLGIQPELNLNINNGFTVKFESNYKSGSLIIGTMTLDIPVLFMIAFPVTESIDLGCGIGPQISIPFRFKSATNVNGIYNDYGNTIYFDGTSIGIAFDINAKINIAKSITLVPDVRYNFDLTPTKARELVDGTIYHYELFVRRGLCIGFGAEYRF